MNFYSKGTKADRTIRLLSVSGGYFILAKHNIYRIVEGVIAVIRSFFAKEEGQGLVEYALILVLIAIVVIGILTLLGGKVSQVFSSISSSMG